MVKLSQATVNWISLNSQDMISFMITTGSLTLRKLLGLLSSEDMVSQVNIYVMNVVWMLCDVYV